MKIAMIHTPFRTRAGGERQILKLAIELQKKGHEVEIFTNGVNWDTYPEFFDKVKINVIPYPLDGKLPCSLTPQMIAPKAQQVSNEKVGGLSKVRRLERKARARILRQYYISAVPPMLEIGRKIPKKFDIINNHNFPTEWAGFIAKARLKVPLVWMCNEPPYWFLYPEQRIGLAGISWPIFEMLDKTTVRYVDEIMVLSHVSEGYVRKAYDRSSRIVRTGVDVELFHNATGKNVRRMYGLEDSFVLLFVGGSKYARRTDAIRTLAILSKKYDNVKLIIDTPREKELLTRLSAELGLKGKVLLLNSRSDVELAEVYAACDAFIYPATVSPWGLVVTEAMVASKPVIVPREVGASELIRNYENGIVVDEASPEKMAMQVEILMNDTKLRKKIGDNAYQYVRNNLSWEKYAEKVEHVFEETLARCSKS